MSTPDLQRVSRPARSRLWLLVLPSLLLFVGAATTTGLIINMLRTQAGEAALVDVTGLIRMLGERYVNEVILAANDLPANHQRTWAQFNAGLLALRDGGPFVDAETGVARNLPPAPTEEIRLAVERQYALVQQQAIAATDLLAVGASDSRYAARLATLRVAHRAAHAAIEHTHVLLDEHGMSRIAVGRTWAITSGALTALLFFGMIAQALRIARLNRELQVSEERFDLAVQGSGDGLWDWDITTDSVYYAPQYKALMGFDDSEYPPVADSFREHLFPEDRERVFAAFMDHLRTRVAFDEEFRHLRKDGSMRYFRARGQAVWNEQGKATRMAGSIADITRLKRVESELREARDSSETANRAKSRFLANMSHELRTPLNSVIGFSNVLLKNKSGNLQPAELSYLERIRDNGKHLLALINELLDISKIEAGRMEFELAPVDLRTIVAEAVTAVEGSALAKRLAVHVDVPDDLDTIIADPTRVKQVVINLAGNAIKFTDRGSVTIRVRTAADSERPATIEVSDTGAGIPADKLDTIFEAFQQADTSSTREHGGTGLGLTISRHLCRLMGFELSAHSEVGRGSSFVVRFEPERRRVAASPARPPGTTGAAGPARRVLVVDNDADSRLLLSEHVRELGYDVVTASSGDEGLLRARELFPDLVMLDLVMPGMNGWEVLHRLKTDPDLRRIPVVVVSIVARENRGMLLGAVDALPKPIDRRQLLDVLHKHLERDARRVLVVDDEPDARKLLCSLIEREGLTATEAGNGREALERLPVVGADLVILDLVMPEMDGIEFLARIREDPRYLDLPVVVVTAKQLTPEQREALEHQTAGVVLKGDRLADRLRRVVERTLEHERATERAPGRSV